MPAAQLVDGQLVVLLQPQPGVAHPGPGIVGALAAHLERELVVADAHHATGALPEDQVELDGLALLQARLHDFG